MQERQEANIFNRDWIRANPEEYDCSAWKDTKPNIRVQPADTHLHLATNRCPVGASRIVVPVTSSVLTVLYMQLSGFMSCPFIFQ